MTVMGIFVPLKAQAIKAIYSTGSAFAALHEDGSIYAWGEEETWRAVKVPRAMQNRN